jgi:predicted MPP superfamily phosphohydrolase
LRIVVVADFQTNVIGDYEASVLRRTMEQKPDVILLAGDYLQARRGEGQMLRSEFKKILRQNPLSAPLGVFAVQGNVDGDTWRDIFDGFDIKTSQTTKTYELDGLNLTCLNLGESFFSKLKVRNRSEDVFHLVLGHVPNFAQGEVSADLIVCGHTHGGQVRFPFIGPIITHATIPNSWAAGMTDLPRGGKLFVSRGVGMERGWSPPIRFLCRSELAIIDLVPEKKGDSKKETTDEGSR